MRVDLLEHGLELLTRTLLLGACPLRSFRTHGGIIKEKEPIQPAKNVCLRFKRHDLADRICQRLKPTLENVSYILCLHG